jgi:hypothetical protein
MYVFLPALTPILALITCTQRNTTPYVVVSGVEVISDTFTVLSTPQSLVLGARSTSTCTRYGVLRTPVHHTISRSSVALRILVL